MIRSPLRYPGGKSRVVSKIAEFLPSEISEYREAMVGGGSLFIYLLQLKPHLKFKINDINKDVYCFWKMAKDCNDELVEEIRNEKRKSKNGRKLYDNVKNQLSKKTISRFERAKCFFILNRISFSGLTTSGGYSKQAFNKRFTDSSIDRLSELKNILHNVQIYNKDYSKLLNGSTKNVLIYLDPPYLKNKNSKLYGNNGDLHLNFNHKLFHKHIQACNHNLIITYDNSIKNINKFHNNENFNIYSMNIKYGMTNITRSKIPKKNELIITNYSIDKNENEKIEDIPINHFFSKKNLDDPVNTILNEIDTNINYWKKLSTLREDLFLNFINSEKKISKKRFYYIFDELIDFLKKQKFIDLSKRKGSGIIILKLPKWNLDRIQKLNFN